MAVRDFDPVAEAKAIGAERYAQWMQVPPFNGCSPAHACVPVKCSARVCEAGKLGRLAGMQETSPASLALCSEAEHMCVHACRQSWTGPAPKRARCTTLPRSAWSRGKTGSRYCLAVLRLLPDACSSRCLPRQENPNIGL